VGPTNFFSGRKEEEERDKKRGGSLSGRRQERRTRSLLTRAWPFLPREQEVGIKRTLSNYCLRDILGFAQVRRRREGDRGQCVGVSLGFLSFDSL